MTALPHRPSRPRLAATLAALTLVTALACADDITLTDGTVFKDAKIIGHTDKKVTITFDSGVAMVESDKVPAALLKTFDVARDIDSAVPSMSSTTSTKRSDSRNGARASTGSPGISPEVKKQVDGGSVHAVGDIIQVVSGKGVVANLTLKFLHQVTVPHTEKKTVDLVPTGLGHTPIMETTTRTWTTSESKEETIAVGVSFIECDPTAFSTGQTWTGEVWPIGVYNYIDEDSEARPIPKFTTRASAAYVYFTTFPERLAALPKDKITAAAPDTTSPVTTTISTSMGTMNGK